MLLVPLSCMVTHVPFLSHVWHQPRLCGSCVAAASIPAQTLCWAAPRSWASKWLSSLILNPLSARDVHDECWSGTPGLLFSPCLPMVGLWLKPYPLYQLAFRAEPQISHTAPFMCFSGSLFVDISGPCVFLKQEFWVTIAASFFPPQVHFSQRIFVSQSTHRLYVENLPKISAQVHLSSRRLNLHSDIYKNNFVLQYVLHVHLRSRYLAGSALPVVFQVRSNYVLLWICCWEKRKI